MMDNVFVQSVTSKIIKKDAKNVNQTAHHVNLAKYVQRAQTLDSHKKNNLELKIINANVLV